MISTGIILDDFFAKTRPWPSGGIFQGNPLQEIYDSNIQSDLLYTPYTMEAHAHTTASSPK